MRATSLFTANRLGLPAAAPGQFGGLQAGWATSVAFRFPCRATPGVPWLAPTPRVLRRNGKADIQWRELIVVKLVGIQCAWSIAH
jgi:hypothetical protein